jgi:hypothetical protein
MSSNAQENRPRVELTDLSDEDRELLELAQLRVEQWFTTLAGEAYPQITGSRIGAEQALASDAEGVRAVALMVLCRRWLPVPEAVELCFAHLTDASTLVVESAVSTLGELLTDTGDVRTGGRWRRSPSTGPGYCACG